MLNVMMHWCSSCCVFASVISFFVMIPIPALLTGMLFSVRSVLSASRLPMVSALMMTPCSVVGMLVVVICSCIHCSAVGASFSSCMVMSGIPDVMSMSSSSSSLMRIPVAAVTCCMLVNFVFFSRMSVFGAGSRSALILVLFGPFIVPMMSSSFTLSIPSYNMQSSTVPSPSCCLTSSTVAFPCPLIVVLSVSSRYFCASPINTNNSSGIPSPVFADSGTIAICVV